MTAPSPTLHRALGFWALVAYGVGGILGAGIYALIVLKRRGPAPQGLTVCAPAVIME